MANNNRTRGHRYTIFKRNCHYNFRKNSFAFRIVDQWNNLPEAIVNAKTVKSFEVRLDKMWKNKAPEVLYDPECDIRTVTSARRVRFFTNTTDNQAQNNLETSSYEDLRSEV